MTPIGINRGMCKCGHSIAYHYLLRGPCNQCSCSKYITTKPNKATNK